MAFDIMLFDDWEDPVLLVDTDNNIRHLNGCACDLLKYRRDEAVGTPLGWVMPYLYEERRIWMREKYRKHLDRSSYTNAIPLTCLNSSGLASRVWMTTEQTDVFGETWTWMLLDADDVAQPKVDGHHEDPPASALVTTLPDSVRLSTRDIESHLGPLSPSDGYFQQVAREVQLSLGFSLFVAALIDTETGTVTTDSVARDGVDPAPGRELGATHSIEGTFSERVVQEQSSILIRNQDTDVLARRFPGTYPSGVAPFRSSMVIPIFDESRVVGAFGIHAVDDIYRPEHMEVILGCLTARLAA